jgi:hypothetical protein
MGTDTVLKISQSLLSRVLVRFDQTNIADTVQGKHLISAELKFYITQNWGGWTSGGREVRVFRLLTNWTEAGSSWNCATSQCSPNWDGGTYASTKTTQDTYYNDSTGWQSFWVTDNVQGFVDGTYSNYGWLIKKQTSSDTGDADYASSEATNSARWPKLILRVRDNTPPAITPSVSPSPNANGWNNTTPVTVTFTCTDTDGCSCTGPYSETSEGQNIPVTGTCTDTLGAQSQLTIHLNIDKTPPGLTSSIDPEPNENGWNRTDVTIHYNPTDDLSGVPSPLEDDYVTSEGANQQIPKTVQDRAGNSSLITTPVSIDKTPPVAAITTPGDNETLDTCEPQVEGTATDALSGIQVIYCNGDGGTLLDGTFTCQTPFTPGANTLTVETYDLAGNVTSSSISLTNPFPAGPSLTFVSPEVVQIGETTAISVAGDGFDETSHLYIDDAEVQITVLSSNVIEAQVNFQVKGVHSVEVRNLSQCSQTSMLNDPALISVDSGDMLLYRSIITPEEISEEKVLPVNIFANDGSFESDATVSFAASGTGCGPDPQNVVAAQAVTYVGGNHLAAVVATLASGMYDVIVNNPNAQDLCLQDGFQVGYSEQEQDAIAAADSSLSSQTQRMQTLNTLQRNFVYVDKSSYSHVTFDQYYRGIKVLDGQMILHMDSTGTVLNSTDEVKYDINVDTTPVLTTQQALAISDSAVLPTQGYSIPPTAQLVIYQNTDGQYVLAYDVHSEADNDVDQFAGDLIIDASTGAILNVQSSWYGSCPTPLCIGNNCTGLGQGHYSGCVPLQTTRPSGVYTLKNQKGNSVLYYDGVALVYRDDANECLNNNIWGDYNQYSLPDSSSFYVTPNGQTDAADAGYALINAINYFKDVLHYTPPFNASVVVHDKSVSGGNGTGIFKKGTVTGGAVWDNQYKRVHVSDNSTSLDLIGP